METVLPKTNESIAEVLLALCPKFLILSVEAKFKQSTHDEFSEIAQ
jgi:hypothetical protein